MHIRIIHIDDIIDMERIITHGTKTYYVHSTVELDSISLRMEHFNYLYSSP